MLGRWDPAAAEPVRQDVAEHVSRWVSVRDAITLDAAHRTIQALPTQWVAAGSASGVNTRLAAELQRVRQTLVQAIMAPPVAPAPLRRGRFPLPLAETAATPVSEPDGEAAFAPYRKHCLDLQRQMELRIDALRAHARAQLALVSPQLAQLAAMDTVMEQMLGERAQKTLAALSGLLERRCTQLRKDGAGIPQAWSGALQELLLAELETRLEPVMGLIEAAGQGGQAGGTQQ